MVMRQPWEADPDAWKGPARDEDEWPFGEPWSREWWEVEAEGYGYAAPEG